MMIHVDCTSTWSAGRDPKIHPGLSTLVILQIQNQKQILVQCLSQVTESAIGRA